MNWRVNATALVILVPEAEVVVREWRWRHDASAAQGMPAHVTILYPFERPTSLTDHTLSRLRTVLGSKRAFRFRLTQTSRFPGVLYLAIDPRAPFDDLTKATCEAFPGIVPYEGAVTDPTPHLTIAQFPDGELLDSLERDFLRSASVLLPVQAVARRVSLMASQDGRWSKLVDFELHDDRRRMT